MSVDLLDLLFPPEHSRGGPFLEMLLDRVAEWARWGLASDGLDYHRAVEHSSTRLRVCGRLCEVSKQTQHVFWLDIERGDPQGSELRWKFYFDLANTSPRFSRNAVDLIMAPESMEWRCVGSGAGLLRDDGLEVSSVDEHEKGE